MEKDTIIGILGAGIEGLEACRYFIGHGFKNVFLFDEKDIIAEKIPTEIRFYGGKDYLEKALSCKIIFRSPGIHINKLIAIGYPQATLITSSTQYFMEHRPCPVIGVTGTKGKGTTSTLITLMLKEAGYDVYLGGNIGQSPLSFLDRLNEKSLVVLEMSSFQLQDLTISPSISVVLRVTSDHLDYHKDREEYMAAKSSIVRFQKPADLVVLNEDYDSSKYYAALTPAKKSTVSRKNPHKNDEGAFVREGKIFFIAGSDEQEPEFIGDISKIALIGAHHLENVLPAVVVARSLQVGKEAIQKVLYSFTGLPHRLEFVREIRGIKYYNDSFSTTPETSVAATYAFEKPVILIAGGSEKGADYTEWGQLLQENPFLKRVILLGAMAQRMEKALNKGLNPLRKTPLEIFHCQNLAEALEKAATESLSGDIVVMSPAAASFDMFRNYKDRGEQFRELVNKLG